MACLLLYLLLLLNSILQFGEGVPVPHVSKFHQPNDYDINGDSCRLRLPSVTRPCPIFGINAQDLTNSEVEATCADYGFSCPGQFEHLFIDGSCRECPDGMIFKEDNSDVYCESPTNSNDRAFANLGNPFDCLSTYSLVIPRNNKGMYRACYNEERNIQAEVEHYATMTDNSNMTTLTACANILHIPITPSVIKINNVYEDFPFSIIGSKENIYAPAGYLQCSIKNAPAKNMATTLWLIVYSCYVIGALIVSAYVLYKYTLEKYKKYAVKSMKSSSSTDLSRDSSEMFKETSFIEQTEISQKGFVKDFFGRVSFYLFIIFLISLTVFLVVIVLDIYGMHYHTLCKGDVALRESCEASIAAGIDPNWRLGYACASGCLFSLASTTGVDQEWPYYNIPGGGPRIGIAFMVIWHLALVLYIFTKIFSKQIFAFFFIRSHLSTCTHVLISKPIEKEIILQSKHISFIQKFSNAMSEFLTKIRGKPCYTKMCKVKTLNGLRFFDFQCLRYAWDEQTEQFQIAEYSINGTQEEITRNYQNGLDESSAANRYMIFGPNAIDIEIENVFKAVFNEVFDYLYMYQLFTLLVWHYTNYWTVTLVTKAIIIISATVKIVTKRRSQWKIKNMAHKHLLIPVYRDEQWQTIESFYLVPGDLIRITQTCIIPSDCVLIDGRCVIDESSLTGEPTPVAKIALNPTSTQQYNASQENAKYTLYAGSTLQSFSPGRSGSTLAVVTATGSSTNKGKLMSKLLFPPPISFTFEQHLNALYIVLLTWSFCIMCVVIWFLNGDLSSWFLAIYAISQVFTPLIPAVYVGALSQGAIHLVKQGVICVNFQRMSLAGKVKIFGFDKTGTLTKPGLEFRGIQYGSSKNQDFKLLERTENYPRFVKMLCGSCHELDFVEDASGGLKCVGNEVDEALFIASGFSVTSVESIPIMKFKETEVSILRRFEFDRATMTMSAIVEDEEKKLYVLTKGSYEAISRIVKPSSLPQTYFQKADKLAKRGIYMLGMAYKPYDGPTDIYQSRREHLETDLLCLGLIMFENPLKFDTPSVINQLKSGNIIPKILTGDNSLTASYIARMSNISTSKRIITGDIEKVDSVRTLMWKDFDTDETVTNPLNLINELESGNIDLAITGRAFIALKELDKDEKSMTPNLSQSTSCAALVNSSPGLLNEILPFIRIFSRLTPDQKVIVISDQMKIGLTGMCGDGANDLGALRLAHCGIAISAGSSEAGLVAPFSSQNESLKSVVDVLKEGRSTLAKAMSGVKALVLFGETKAIIAMLQHYFAVIPAELYWISWDAVIYLGTAWCILQSNPTSRLSKTRPTAKLFGFETIFSVCSSVFLNIFFFIGAIIILFNREWFLCREFDANSINHLQWWLKGDNYEAEIISVIATFQFIAAGPTSNFGYKYRKAWWKNYWMTIFTLIVISFFTYLFLVGPSTISCLFRTNCGDQSLIQHWINEDHLPRINVPPTAPEGCPCSEQYATGLNLCEEEYTSCTNNKFNSRYHHNIIPAADRVLFYSFGFCNMLLVIIWEAFVVLGPIRTLGKKWNNKRKMTSAKTPNSSST